MRPGARFIGDTPVLAATLQAAAAALPQPKTENGVTYVNGGIGRDEAAAMKAEARQYPMTLVFSAGKDNACLAGVKLTIRLHRRVHLGGSARKQVSLHWPSA